LDDQISELINTVMKILQQQMFKYTDMIEIDKTILKMGDGVVDLEEQVKARNSLFSQIVSMADLVESYRIQIAKALKIEENSWAKVLAEDFAGKEQLSNVVQSLPQTVKEIIELEKEVMAFLKCGMAEAQKELRAIAQYKELSQAYLDRPEKFPEPQVFDKTK